MPEPKDQTAQFFRLLVLVKCALAGNDTGSDVLPVQENSVGFVEKLAPLAFAHIRYFNFRTVRKNQEEDIRQAEILPEGRLTEPADQRVTPDNKVIECIILYDQEQVKV